MAVSNFYGALFFSILVCCLILESTNGQRQTRTRDRNEIRSDTLGSGLRRPGSTRPGSTRPGSTRSLGRQRGRGSPLDRNTGRGRARVFDPFKTCPATSPRVPCDPALCSQSTCDRFPNATCVLDSCGDCHVDWFVGMQIVNCHEGRRIDCPPGIIPRRRCNSCRHAFCELHPEAECRVDSCSKCKAVFFVNDQKVSCRPPLNLYDPCPNPTNKRYMCPKEMCRFDVCPNNHRIYCSIDNCGGCHAIFRFKWTKDISTCPGYWSQFEEETARRGYEYNGTLPTLLYDNPDDRPITQANDPRRKQNIERPTSHDHSHSHTDQVSSVAHSPHDHLSPETPSRDIPKSRQRQSSSRTAIDPHGHATAGDQRGETLHRSLPDLSARSDRQHESPTRTVPDPHGHAATGDQRSGTLHRGLPDLSLGRDRQPQSSSRTVPDPHDHITSASGDPSRETLEMSLSDFNVRRNRLRQSPSRHVPDPHGHMTSAAGDSKLETLDRGVPDLDIRKDRQRQLPTKDFPVPHDQKLQAKGQRETATFGRRLPDLSSFGGKHSHSASGTALNTHDHPILSDGQPSMDTLKKPALGSITDQVHQSTSQTKLDPQDHQTSTALNSGGKTQDSGISDPSSRRNQQHQSQSRTMFDRHDHRTPSEQPRKETLTKPLADVPSRRNRQRQSTTKRPSPSIKTQNTHIENVNKKSQKNSMSLDVDKQPTSGSDAQIQRIQPVGPKRNMRERRIRPPRRNSNTSRRRRPVEVNSGSQNSIASIFASHNSKLPSQRLKPDSSNSRQPDFENPVRQTDQSQINTNKATRENASPLNRLSGPRRPGSNRRRQQQNSFSSPESKTTEIGQSASQKNSRKGHLLAKNTKSREANTQTGTPQRGPPRRRPSLPKVLPMDNVATEQQRPVSRRKTPTRRRSITGRQKDRPTSLSRVPERDNTASANDNRRRLRGISPSQSTQDNRRRETLRQSLEKRQSRGEILSRILQASPSRTEESRTISASQGDVSQSGQTPLNKLESKSARAPGSGSTWQAPDKPRNLEFDNSQLDMQLGLNFMNTLNKNPVPITLFDISGMIGESSGVPILNERAIKRK